MSEDRLRPARVERKGKRPDYAPRPPWKGIAMVAVLAAVLIGYFLHRHNEAEALRQQIVSTYQQKVEPSAREIRRFRARIEKWVTEAAGEAPEPWADPRLKLSGLHEGQGLYLRLRAEDARSPEDIAEGAGKARADAIPRCLGLSPVSLRGLYRQGGFLDPQWLNRAREAGTLMRLRVVQDELQRHIRRDLPMLANMLSSDYFLLALQRSESRREGPVDVYLWDLRRNEQLLRVRTRPSGLLLPVRIRMGDPPAAPGSPSLESGGAVDCSIAAQIKKVTGEPALGVGPTAAQQLQQTHGTAEDAGADGASTAGDAGGRAGSQDAAPEAHQPTQTPSIPDPDAGS